MWTRWIWAAFISLALHGSAAAQGGTKPVRAIPERGVADATAIMPVQIPVCYAPGAQICINGWVWVCRCFSYGCQYMTTAYRCR